MPPLTSFFPVSTIENTYAVMRLASVIYALVYLAVLNKTTRHSEALLTSVDTC